MPRYGRIKKNWSNNDAHIFILHSFMNENTGYMRYTVHLVRARHACIWMFDITIIIIIIIYSYILLYSYMQLNTVCGLFAAAVFFVFFSVWRMQHGHLWQFRESIQIDSLTAKMNTDTIFCSLRSGFLIWFGFIIWGSI